MTPESIGALARNVLSALGGFVVAKGWLGAEELQALIGGVVVIGTTIWSLVQKRKAKEKLADAIAAPAGKAV